MRHACVTPYWSVCACKEFCPSLVCWFLREMQAGTLGESIRPLREHHWRAIEGK